MHDFTVKDIWCTAESACSTNITHSLTAGNWRHESEIPELRQTRVLHVLDDWEAGQLDDLTDKLSGAPVIPSLPCDNPSVRHLYHSAITSGIPHLHQQLSQSLWSLPRFILRHWPWLLWLLIAMAWIVCMRMSLFEWSSQLSSWLSWASLDSSSGLDGISGMLTVDIISRCGS